MNPRASQVISEAPAALTRLLDLAKGSTGQTVIVGQFLGAIYNTELFKFNLSDLNCVDSAIADDMMILIETLRWDKRPHQLIADGDARIQVAMEKQGVDWPS